MKSATMAAPERASFDIPEDVTYINCAYLSPLLNTVVSVGREAVARKARPWQILHKDFFEEVEALRVMFAGLIGATADDIAIVPSTAYGIATAAANIPLRPGDNVVLPDAEHASSFHKWRVHAAESGAELRAVAVAADGDWADAIIARIDARTRVVSVPHVHWSDGRLFDLDRIGDAARKVGASFVIDGTQSIGALPLGVAALRPDYLTCSAYKWLFCPYGFAFLYVAPAHQGGRPFEEHYFHRANAAAHEGKLEHILDYDRGARRFDMGERANFITGPMSVVALRQLAEWTVPGVQARIAPLSEAIIEGARRLGYFAHPEGRRVPHLFGLRREGGLPAALGASLAAAKVFVSIRGDAIRVSPNVYNDARDVERFLAVLEAAG
jgi:selenocysteine lyase/cysteine desulfurase